MLKHTSKLMRRSLTAASFVALIGTISCDFKNPLEDTGLILNFAGTKSVGAIAVVDARTGEPLTVPVTVRFTGADAARISDLTADPVPASGAEIDAESGLFIFGVTGNEVTEGSPARVTVNVQASGYLETSEDIVLGQAENPTRVIRLVNFASPPQGAASGSGSISLGTSGVVSAVTIQTAAEEVAQTRTSVTIPAGTVVRNRAGAVMAGTLQGRVVHFNGISDSSLAAFPGGFDARVENPPSGAAPEIVFTPAGFTGITLTDGGGTEAHTFTQPIAIAIDVARDTDNPVTGAKVKAGDVVPYWSFDATTGAWRYEGDATLTGPDANGNFKGSFNTTHLSYYNLDWYQSSCALTKLTISGNSSRSLINYTMYRNNRFFYWWSGPESSISFRGAPTGPVRVEARLASTNVLVGNANIANLCANPSMSVSLPATVSISVDLKAICPSGTQLRPLIYLNISRVVGTKYHALGGQYIYDGRGTISGLVPNTDYHFNGVGSYKGKWANKSMIVRTPAKGTMPVRMSVQLGSGVC